MEAENQSKLGHSLHLHKKFEEIAGIYENQNISFIKNKTNNIILDTEELLLTSRKYTVGLFQDDRPWNPENEITNISGPSILKSEIRRPTTLMNDNWDPGHDQMY